MVIASTHVSTSKGKSYFKLVTIEEVKVLFEREDIDSHEGGQEVI